MCTVINFIVFWTICLCSSPVHFKNSAEYFTKRTAQVFITLIRFLRQNSVSRSSRSYERLFFIFIFVSSACLMCPLPVFPGTCNLPFLQAFWLFLYLVVLFLPLFVFSRFLLWAWYIFLCQISFLHPGFISLLCLSVSNSFSFFQAVWYHPCT